MLGRWGLRVRNMETLMSELMLSPLYDDRLRS